jgi:two-component system, NarL family, sensor kinase
VPPAVGGLDLQPGDRSGAGAAGKPANPGAAAATWDGVADRTPTVRLRPLPAEAPVVETPPMAATDGRPPRRGLTVFAVTATLVVVVAVASMLLRGRPVEVLYARWLFHNAPTAIALLWLGHALARRQPGHGLARPFLVAGVASALHVAAICLADARLVAAGLGDDPVLEFVPAALPLDASVPFWFSSWLWLLPAGMAATVLLLLFPTGRLPSPRWRPLLPLIGIGIGALIAAYMVAAWPGSDALIDSRQPPDSSRVASVLVAAGGSLLLVATIASIASLGLRWRRAPADERQQVRAVAATGAVLAIALTALWPWQAVWIPVSLVLILGFLTTYVIAVLRFRLHDLDVAINRTVVASVLAALITGLYLLVVVGVGGLVGRSSQRPLLPLVAVGLVALVIEPARRRVRRLVDRWLYGRDADAYEVLSELAGQLRDAGAAGTVAARVADLLVRGTGAGGARITMTAAGTPRVLAESGEITAATPALVAPIVHDGQELGEVQLHARSSSDLAPDAGVLVHDVAGTLGAVLRNRLLTDELTAQVAELRRSRERLLTAQDEARRELERDLHDGAQARLVALRLQLGIAATRAAALADTDEVHSLRALLDQLGVDTDVAIRSLRDLSRGLHPPVLESAGVASALRAGVRGLPVEVVIEASELGRAAPTVETAVYFCCLEAIKNAAAHAGARRIVVTLGSQDGWLRFTVEDDGCGFDPRTAVRGRGLSNLEDRVSGLGGHLSVDTGPDRGTRVRGALPAQPLVSER